MLPSIHEVMRRTGPEENMFSLAKAARVFAVATIALLTLSASVSAQQPSGDIRIRYITGGFIVGGAGGSGTLVYKGKAYPLNVGGLSIGLTIGLAEARFRGQVYNLRNIRDIEGTYTASDAGYALIRGRKVSTLRNSRGVVLALSGRQVGVEATLDVSGMTISLK
jgi:hypothetical protein